MKTIKMILILMLASAFMFTLSIPAFAENDNITKCYNLATNALKLYYECVDTGQTFEYEQIADINPILLAYIKDKVTTQLRYAETNALLKTNYFLTFNLLSFEYIGEAILLSIQTKASFNYIDLPNISSGFSEVSDIVFVPDSNTWMLNDWYIQEDYYDMFTRGSASSYLSLTQSDKFCPLSDNSVSQRQAQIDAQLREYDISVPPSIQPESSNQEIVLDGQPTQTRATLYSLNKTSISNYAKNYCSYTSPPSGGSGVPYYDFSQISGAYDCTNFVSHSLLAGGAVMYDSGISGITGTTYWYFRSTANRSSPWAGVNELFSFLIN